MAGRSVATIAGALCLLAPAAAGAGPLSLSALDALSVALRCRSFCNSPVGRDACTAACPKLESTWEKDGEAPIEALDYELALVEYWDGGRKEAICEAVVRMPDGTSLEAVRPEPLCTPPVDCKTAPSPAECADADGDGLPQWQETEAGTSDQQRDTLCRANVDCSFAEACGFVFGHGRMLCAARPCGEEGCKAFRLEAASVTNEEVIVHVVFEYAPSPVTVLDLKLDYSFEVLELLDARPLALLDAAGKSVTVSHLADRKLRVVVAGALSTVPVPYGAIVELVFWRKDSTRQAAVGFSDDPVHRRYSMAPEQGAAQDDLVDDGPWGSDIPIGVGDPAGPRLLLSYAFEDPAAPLDVRNVSSAADLCARIAGCPGSNVSSQLESLQAGLVLGGEPIHGVRGEATYLRGTQDHLRFPLTHTSATEQSFTLAGWFYAEKSYEPSGSAPPQVLFSHLAMDERTAFGLLLEPRPENQVDLVWFEGEHDRPPARVVLRAGLPILRWTHVTVSYDDSTDLLAIFVDGEKVHEQIFASGLACPQVEPTFAVHTLGDVTGGAGSGAVYFSRVEKGLHRIERTDPLGLAVEPVLASEQASYRDPDYNAGIDRIVYVSNERGDANERGALEVWMADRRGDDRKQLTVGFGDPSRGIVARRPRLSPGGKGIVFESNVYDLAKNDNTSRTFQLYYLPVGRDADGSPTVTQLSYATSLASNTLGDHRLTSGYEHSTGGVWLAEGSGASRGEIVYTTSSPDYRTQKMARLVMNGQEPQELDLGAGGAPLEQNVQILDAHVSQDGLTRRVLVERSWSELASASQFGLTVTVSHVVEVKVTHEPSGYAADCWDRDGNGAFDALTEDRDADGVGTVADCYPTEIRDLYVSYDLLSAHHELTQARPGEALESTEVGGLAKVVRLTEEFPGASALVRVDVTSPYHDRPIPAGTELVTLVFTPLGAAGGPNGGAGAFEPQTRTSTSAVYVKTLDGGLQPLPVGNYLHDAKAGAFSPNGDAVLLSGFWQSRPVLVRATLQEPASVLRLPAPGLLEHLSFRQQEQLMACNWIGAYRDPYTGVYRNAFRGGLDEVALYSYAREATAIRSEVERGREWLVKAGPAGIPVARIPTCLSSDLECPRYMLCNRTTQRCESVGCSAGVPESCARGLCTAKPIDIDAGGSDLRWVCTAECASDTECFVESCLNGPCRFCDDATSSCVECRETVSNAGSGLAPIVTVEGCPDRNSYACENGSCYSECVSFENNQSQYLCKSPVEYCQAGRCVPADWTWAHLAPATLAGADEMFFHPDHQPGFATVALDPMIPVKIWAFGVSDYLRSPQVLVEGCRADGSCFEIGEISVDHRTSQSADESAYVLHTPWRFEKLCLRLVVPPHDNLNEAATGWLGDTSAFCQSNGAIPDPCVHKSPGSLHSLGYPAEVPSEVILAAAGVVDNHLGRMYLRPGAPAVIVTRVEVAGSGLSQPSSNFICSYEGTSEPLETSTDPATGQTRRRWRKMFFGAREISHHRDRFCADNPCGSGWGVVDLAPQNKGWGVLNCAFADSASGVAAATYNVVLTPPSDGDIIENSNLCQYKAPARRSECYEWEYRPSIDVFNAEVQLFHTLDFEDFGSLGPDEGFALVQP